MQALLKSKQAFILLDQGTQAFSCSSYLTNIKDDPEMLFGDGIIIPEWKNASTILLYAPLPGEPNLLNLLAGFPEKKFLFPRIVEKRLLLYQWRPHVPWLRGRYNIQEPDPQTWKEVPAKVVDIALIPGLAFDHDGRRLGRGGGFYDRLLGDSEWRGVKVGVAWPWQIVKRVPCEPHDMVMDTVLT